MKEGWKPMWLDDYPNVKAAIVIAVFAAVMALLLWMMYEAAC